MKRRKIEIRGPDGAVIYIQREYVFLSPPDEVLSTIRSVLSRHGLREDEVELMIWGREPYTRHGWGSQTMTIDEWRSRNETAD